MSSSRACCPILLLLYFIERNVASNLKWHSWIDLPDPMSKMVATRFNRWIYVIGGNTTDRVYRINASATTQSNATWQRIDHLPDKPPPDPSSHIPIEIRSDSFITIDSFTYIFGPRINRKDDQIIEAVYAYDHSNDEFFPVPPDGPNPDDEPNARSPLRSAPPKASSSPCVVYSHPFIYVIGGTTSESDDEITCLSTTQVYDTSIDNKDNEWTIVSTEMPWDSDRRDNSGLCYGLCQVYRSNIYLFGGVSVNCYSMNLGDGPSHGMQWKKVSNDTIDGGIINTNSILVGDRIYAFAGGKVQTVELSKTSNVRMSSKEMDSFTPKRCFSGNVYDGETERVYVIGGSDCDNSNDVYSDVIISGKQNNGNDNNGGLFSDFTHQDWVYFGSGFAIAILVVLLLYMVTIRVRRKKKNDENLLSGHIQESVVGAGSIVSSVKSERRKLSAISEVSDRPGVDM